MKSITIFASFFFFIQILACTNTIESEEIDVKLNIVNRNSDNPRYELVFYHEGEKVAKRVFENGNVILTEGEIPDGQVIEKYNGGKIRNIFAYQKGKRNGKAFSFYENGKLKKESIYLNDNPVGITKMYFENGNLKMVSKTENGKNVYYKDYHENGQLKQEVYYKSNKIIRKMYDVDGRIISD
ncbi:toxin-antitoxin system YwqK family antitoxin [Thermodesulfobacteriota bacterium]